MLKKQLEESKIERRHKEECESIRKLIATQPPRSETLKIISDLEKEIAALDAENTTSSRTLELRKKQFALLLHVVDELQNTIEEEQRSLIEEKEQKKVDELQNPCMLIRIRCISRFPSCKIACFVKSAYLCIDVS